MEKGNLLSRRAGIYIVYKKKRIACPYLSRAMLKNASTRSIKVDTGLSLAALEAARFRDGVHAIWIRLDKSTPNIEIQNSHTRCEPNCFLKIPYSLVTILAPTRCP